MVPLWSEWESLVLILFRRFPVVIILRNDQIKIFSPGLRDTLKKVVGESHRSESFISVPRVYAVQRLFGQYVKYCMAGAGADPSLSH